jgi:membrane protease YdiL (CAAX protease family)
LAGALLVSIITLALDPASNIQDPGALRFIQALSAIGTFFMPAIVVSLLCSKKPYDYLFIKQFPDIKIALLTFVSMFLLSPAITLTGVLNKSMKFPQFLERIERWMQLLEEEAERLTTLLLSDTGVISILLNLLVVAVIAAITEEFFFRGVLQRIMGKWFKNRHAVIWSVAFIFSAIHLQFYGLIPRMLLGAYFGYLLYWSKNIWIPVLAHFCNNAVAVIGMTDSNLKESEYISGEIQESEMLPFVVIATVTFILFCFCANYLRKSFRRV